MLTLLEYVNYFLVTGEPEGGNEHHHHHGLLLATVYQTEAPEYGDNLVYTRKMAANKNCDPVASLVTDLIGETTSTPIRQRRQSTTTGVLAAHTCVTIEIVADRSPGNVGAEQLHKLLDHCKRNAIKCEIHYSFAHPFSWDNKYNREGLKTLQARGVNIKLLGLQEMINMAVSGVEEVLESLSELETCRGTLQLNVHMVKRAVDKFRAAIQVHHDPYRHHLQLTLHDILGTGIKKSEGNYDVSNDEVIRTTRDDVTTFPLTAYRDYFLLQNSDTVWAKLHMSLTTRGEAKVKDEILFDRAYTLPIASNMLGKVDLLGDQLWKLVGEKVTLLQLSTCDEMLIHLTGTVNEYPDEAGWYRTLTSLHHQLETRIAATGHAKVKVGSTLRYAMTSGHHNDDETAPDGTASTTVVECMHVQDILLDMLEDLDDNLKMVGQGEYQSRGGGVRVERSTLAAGLGLLNRAICVRQDGHVNPMNSDFVDVFADTLGV